MKTWGERGAVSLHNLYQGGQEMNFYSAGKMD